MPSPSQVLKREETIDRKTGRGEIKTIRNPFNPVIRSELFRIEEEKMKRIVSLSVIFVLIGLNLYAGDLTVTGKVGIGTTNLVSELTVSGGSANWNEAVQGLTTGSFHLNPGSVVDNFGSAITFGASDFGNGDNAQAGIYIRSDGTYGTKMYFSTTDAYATGSKTRMMINHLGNVGIGTTIPSTKVEIDSYNDPENSSLTPLGAFSIKTTASTAMVMGVSNGSPYEGWVQMRHGTVAGYTYPLSFQPLGGNVGIGTTNPGEKLEVSGNIKSTGNIKSNTYIAANNLGEAYGGQGGVNSNYYHSAINDSWFPYPGDNHNYIRGTTIFGDTGGSVGIATYNPQSKLSVGGDGGSSAIYGNTPGLWNGIWGNGNVGVYGTGNSSSAYTTGVYGSGAYGVAGYGTIYNFVASGPGVNYGSFSSIRWKNNITPIVDPLSKIREIRGVYFDWDDYHGGRHDIGFIGEEVAKVVPEITVADPDAPGYITGMDYSKMTPLLLEAIKAQQKQIELLRAEVEELKKLKK
jgi:endosialidase-like protein